jgi:putative transposase
MAETEYDIEMRKRRERAQRIGLFRYEVIQDVLDPALTARQRGALARELSTRAFTSVDGQEIHVSRTSVDRWIRAWKVGGFPALVPAPVRVDARTPAEILALAAALKRENPQRTATQVARILRAQGVLAPSERTLQRHFVRLGIDQAGTSLEATVFGRFEADRPNELWVGDALHGPSWGGRKTYLFAFLDDHSRAVMGARFGFSEDAVRLAAALHPALAARGVPTGVYVDNGAAFVDTWLRRACATLNIRLIHSTPRRPQGRGKIERFFRTVREQFLVEADALLDGVTEAEQVLPLLNRHFTAWVEQVYHPRPHSETSAPPLTRWLKAGAPTPVPPDKLREAFLWSSPRTVTKTATVSFEGNLYQVEPALAGRKIDLLYDPFDLTVIEARYGGVSFGTLIPHQIRRHSHPKARPELPADPPPAPTGIDYLGLIADAHQRDLGPSINYTALDFPTDSTDSTNSTEAERC